MSYQMPPNTQPRQYDIIYYSKFCKSCDQILQYMSRNNLLEQFSFINVDKRSRHPQTNQVVVHLENGKSVVLPYAITNVPSLCLVNQKYRVLVGNEIIQHLEPLVKNNKYNATPTGEPMGANATNLAGNYMDAHSLKSSEMGSLSGSFSTVMPEHSQLQILTPPEDFKSARLSDGAAASAMKMMQEDMNKYVPPAPAYDAMPATIPVGGGGNGGGQQQNYQSLQYR